MSYYRPQVPDLVGGAIDTATKMYGLLNAPEDRRRKQAQEDMAMETARLQQDAARLNLDTAKEDRERKKALQLVEPYIAQYDEWERSNYAPEKEPVRVEGIQQAFELLGAKLPLSGNDVRDALQRQKASKEALAMLNVAKTKYAGQLKPGQRVPLDLQEFTSRLGQIDAPERYTGVRESKAPNGGKYELRGLSGRIYAEAGANGEIRIVPGILRVDYDASGAPIEDTLREVPATATADDDPNGRLNFKTLDELESKLQAASTWNGAYSYAGLAAAGSKAAEKAQTKVERKEQFAAIEKSDFISQLPPAYQGAAKSFVSFFKATGGDPTQLKQQLGTLMTKAAELEVSESEMAEILPAYQKALRAVQNVKGSPSARESKAFEAINQMGMRSTTGLKVMEMVRASIASDIKAEEAEANRQATVRAAAIKGAGGTGGVAVADNRNAINDFQKILNDANAALATRVVVTDSMGMKSTQERKPDPQQYDHEMTRAAILVGQIAASGTASPQAVASMLNALKDEKYRAIAKQTYSGQPAIQPNAGPKMAASHKQSR